MKFMQLLNKKDFYIMRIWRIYLIWVAYAEHTYPDNYFEIWQSEGIRVLVFGKHGIGVGLL